MVEMKRRQFLCCGLPLLPKVDWFQASEATILFGGDVCLSSPQRIPSGQNFEAVLELIRAQSGNQSMYDYCFSDMASFFESADLVMVNLESPITESNDRLPKKFNFKANPDYVNILSQSGIGIVTIANNHIMDFGARGLEDTVSLLDEEGISYIGADMNLSKARTPIISAVKSYTFGMLAYTSIGPGQVFAAQSSAGAVRLDENYYVNDINAIRDSVDFVIVNVHWGHEGTHYPVDYQKMHARKMVDAGANVVIGHHPHVIQGAEKYKDGIIFYSLGNFMFGGNSIRSLRNITECIVPKVHFSSSGIRSELLPVRITSHDLPYHPVEHSEKQRLLDFYKKLSGQGANEILEPIVG
ncbi:MAG: CapA family protein [Candidatus Woesearchaeota archaeon]